MRLRGHTGGATGRDARWLLPGEVAVLESDRPRRRTPRDWTVDLVLFTAAVAFWAAEQSQAPGRYAGTQPDWFLTVDPWLGAAACLALWWRRRLPLLLVWVMLPAMIIAGTATGAAVVAILTVAVHRAWLIALASTAPYVMLVAPYAFEYPSSGTTPWESVAITVAMFVVPVSVGIAVRSRRQVLVSLHRAAERERREHQLRLAEARRAERERIAREMHDVLAHRISLLSVHAGALAYRTTQAESASAPELDLGEVSGAVAVIRDNANQALAELGEVLSLLRGSDPDDRLAQNGLAQLDRLVQQADAAGQDVRLRWLVPSGPTNGLRAQVQRTAYRMVQEGLTNARKHAPGTPVEVVVVDGPGGELELSVTNPMPAYVGGLAATGAGVGLTGLAERVFLDGGTLCHGVVDGSFELSARLPWVDDHGGERTDPDSAR